MPPVEWIELGYQGYGLPQAELLWALAFDHRFGLFVSSPLLLLAVVNLFMDARGRRLLPARETAFIYLLFVALWVFFSGSNYTRLQYNTGVRYMMPIIPFLFVPAALCLSRLRRPLAYGVALLAVTQAWCLAMIREVERPLGVLDPVIRVFVEGFQLPALRTLSRSGGYYMGLGADGVSPLPLLVLTGIIIFCLWKLGLPSTSDRSGRGIGMDRPDTSEPTDS